MTAEIRLKELGLELPPAPKPAGVYKPMLLIGNVAYLSGHGPVQSDGSFICGRVGVETDVKGGYAAARQTGLAMLATLRENLKSLDRIICVVKVLGMVNASPDFTEHPTVINGFSELMRDMFGEERGVGTRSAVGMGSLPGNITTEIEAIFMVAVD